MNAKHVFFGGLGVAAVTLVAGSAQASGYLSARFGTDHGTPAMANPYAIYYNPAALGGTQGTQVTVDGMFVLRSLSYTRADSALSTPTSTDPVYRSANTGKSSLLNVLALPFVGVTTDLGMKDLRLGFASYVPFGGSTNWKKNDTWAGNTAAPGAVDGSQRWHNITGSTLSLFNTLAVAYKIEPAKLTIGANFSLVYNSLKTVRARNADGSDNMRASNGALIEGRSLVEVSAVNFAAGFGLFWEPTDKLRVGASYTLKPGFGEMKMKGQLTQQFGAAKDIAKPQDVDFYQTYPDVIRAGGAYRISDAIELRMDVLYVRWSAFKRQCLVQSGYTCTVDNETGADSPDGKVVVNIVRNWKDTFGGRAGVGYFLNDSVEIFGSVGFNTSPVPKETIDPTSFDSFRTYLTAGGHFMVMKQLGVGASFTQILFATVNTSGTNKVYGPPSKTPSGDGVYKSTVSLLDVNVTYAF